VSANDASYLAADVPMSSVASHASHLHYLYTHGNRHRRAFLHSRRPYLRAIGQSPACHAEFLGRKAREVKDFNWASVGLDVVTAKTKYPEPKAQAS